MVVDKFRLIEVRKRPALWDSRVSSFDRNRKKIDELWAEVGKVLKQKAFKCRHTWHNRLRVQFCHEATRIARRVAKAKKEGNYDTNKKYYFWEYFDALRFLTDGLSPKATFDLNCLNNSSVEMVESDQTKKPQSGHKSDGGKETLVEIHNESDSDIEMTDNNNLDQSQKKPHFKNLTIPNESNNTSQIITVHDSNNSAKDKNKKSNTVSPNNLEQESECAQTSNNNIRQNYAAIKEEPELQINDENEFITEIQEIESPLVSTPAQRNCSDSQKLTKHNLNTYDQDHIFLYSFLSTTRLMTPLQTREFRAGIKSLLVDIFPASPSLNIFEKQLLLPDDNDPDRKFLISFWPFIKSMPLKQNLQFRAKMADLVLKIMSTRTTL